MRGQARIGQYSLAQSTQQQARALLLGMDYEFDDDADLEEVVVDEPDDDADLGEVVVDEPDDDADL